MLKCASGWFQVVIDRAGTLARTFLLGRFSDEMSPGQPAAKATLAGLWDMPRLGCYAALRRCGLGLEGLSRNTALFIVVTRARRLAPAPAQG